jgi:hypothetical protein
MADMTIEQFCDLHGACREGREWAMENCQTMQEVWDTAKPLLLIWVATRRGVLSDRELRLFAAARAAEVAAAAAAAARCATVYAAGGAAAAAARAAASATYPAVNAARYATVYAAEAAAALAEWLRTNCTPRFTQVAGKEEVTS